MVPEGTEIAGRPVGTRTVGLLAVAYHRVPTEEAHDRTLQPEECETPYFDHPGDPSSCLPNTRGSSKVGCRMLRRGSAAVTRPKSCCSFLSRSTHVQKHLLCVDVQCLYSKECLGELSPDKKYGRRPEAAELFLQRVTVRQGFATIGSSHPEAGDCTCDRSVRPPNRTVHVDVRHAAMCELGLVRMVISECAGCHCPRSLATAGMTSRSPVPTMA